MITRKSILSIGISRPTLIAAVLLATFAASCSSGVDQSEYDALVAENEDLRSQLETATSTTTEPPSEIQTLAGTFTLIDSDVVGSWTRCGGSGGYDDFGAGMNVTARDGSGRIVGSGNSRNLTESDLSSDLPGLAAAAADESEEDGIDVTCVVSFEIEVEDADFYEIEVGSRGGLSYSRADLDAADWFIELSLS